MPKKPAAEAQMTGFSLPNLDYDEGSDEQNVNGEAKKTPADDRVSSLEQRLAEQDARIAKLQEERIALMSTPLVTVPPQPPKPMTFDGLPDAALDQEAHDRALVQRYDEHKRAEAEYNAQVNQASATVDQRKQALWEEFQVEFEDYAADPEKAAFIADRVVKRVMAKGVDRDKYMLQHSDKFKADVVAEFDKVFGKPSDEDDDDIEPLRTPRKKANRTEGMLGGNEGGARPSGDHARAAANDMFKDIREFQIKNGFY